MKRRIGLILLLGILVVYFLGDQPDELKISFNSPSDIPNDLNLFDSYLAKKEAAYDIKPDNESQIHWADPDSIAKTEFAIVYLHGFSASPGEGLPIHKEIAKEYGMNLFIPRLNDHGLVSDENLLNFSPAHFVNDAYQAIKIGEQLGEKVIVMSCSTGGTASLYCAAHSDANIHAQVLYSPNIDLYDSKTWLLTKPWGLSMARLVKGSDYNVWEVPNGAEQYWYGKYRLESTVSLKNMLECLMTEKTFNKVTVPTMVGYYYKNEEFQDEVVSVECIKSMISQLGTNKENQFIVQFENVEAHALQSQFFSKDLDSVFEETRNYFENQLGIKKPL